MTPTEHATSALLGTLDTKAKKAWIRQAHAHRDLVGIVYHTPHHLLSGLPNHDLGKAQRRLAAHFGAHSPYAVANHSNALMVVWDLLKSASKIRRKDSAIHAWRAEHQG